MYKSKKSKKKIILNIYIAIILQAIGMSLYLSSSILKIKGFYLYFLIVSQYYDQLQKKNISLFLFSNLFQIFPFFSFLPFSCFILLIPHQNYKLNKIQTKYRRDVCTHVYLYLLFINICIYLCLYIFIYIYIFFFNT